MALEISLCLLAFLKLCIVRLSIILGIASFFIPLVFMTLDVTMYAYRTARYSLALAGERAKGVGASLRGVAGKGSSTASSRSEGKDGVRRRVKSGRAEVDMR